MGFTSFSTNQLLKHLSVDIFKINVGRSNGFNNIMLVNVVKTIGFNNMFENMLLK